MSIMQNSKMSSRFAAIGLFIGLGVAPIVVAAQPYQVTPVPTAPDMNVADINDARTMVGWAGSNERALIIENGIRFIDGIPGDFNFATDISNAGVVAGRYQGAGVNGVFTHDADTQITTILPTDDLGSSWVNAINDSGVMVGAAGLSGVIWVNGQRFFANDLMNGGVPYPIRDVTAVDNQGRIVGFVDAPNYNSFLGLPAPKGGYVFTPLPFGDFAIAMSDNAGLLLFFSLNDIKVRDLDGSGVFTMPRFPSNSYVMPAAINDSGIVVGGYNDSTTYHGFLWDSASGMRQSLDSLVREEVLLHFSSADAINNQGVILARGENNQGQYGTFLLTPPCFGDADDDGSVDLGDLATVLSRFGTTLDAAYGTGDLNGDRQVDLTDLQRVLSNFGRSCQK